MKVLFAVNNENISESIIKKYQKDYKEILTYKNVYYFNAILKELQRDKTYDRIVISEDLEQFANNNYDIIDKFLFEKLDKISDEATEASGNDTPIILICTDRRSKTDGILIKLFGIGIYSAIIGQDRSIDEVCRLIYMPRTKKEAKLYYRIEADEVTYKTESESNVSEVEIQNILAHYKRLGKNTERYVDSFNNIAAQYTDSQLRVIVKFLPLNVKAVLEAESPKYQEVIMSNDKNAKKQAIKYGTTVNKDEIKASKKTAKKGIELDAFETRAQQTNLTNSVVIPSVVGTTKPKKIESQQGSNIEKRNTAIPQQPKFVEQDEDFFDIEGLEEKEEITDQIEDNQEKRGRGRPRKFLSETGNQLQELKRGRGRPKKISEADVDFSEFEEENNPVNLYNIDDDIEEDTEKELTQEDSNNEVNLFGLDEENLGMDDEYEVPNTSQAQIPEQENRTNLQQNEDTNDHLNLQNNKVVSFVGTTKNGTSFLINNLGLLFSSKGIKTAILDLTRNRNSYYIFTKNDEELRKKAINSFASLEKGIADGVAINNFLTSYTSLPGEKIQNINYNTMIQTLRNHYQLVLIDCDFSTQNEVFKNSNEIYFVQSMDILTIQPLTAFMRDLKTSGILEQEKLRVVINKYQKLRGLTDKTIIGGLSSYNDPAMTYMTELFNKDTIKYVNIPLDIGVYTNYLEGLVTCELSTKGFSRSFSESLNILATMIYPDFNTNNYSNKKKDKNQYQPTTFNANVNNTLNQMKTKY